LCTEIRKTATTRTLNGSYLNPRASLLRLASLCYPPIEERDPLIRPGFTGICGHRFTGKASGDLGAPFLDIFVFRQVEGFNHAVPLIGCEERSDVQGEAYGPVHVSLLFQGALRGVFIRFFLAQ
jgi:hypothetical protein